ncbi:MAG: transglycosylase SLT domain-containing protein [Halobacteriovoraceae bacterium]|nr:transglycosylase SLT domain-containing protein [Halobacteriovoraceae bacterium]
MIKVFAFTIFILLGLTSCSYLNLKLLSSDSKEFKNKARRIVGSAKLPEKADRGKGTYYLHGAEHLKLDNYYYDIPVVYNAAVKKWMNYFLNKGRGFFERYGARAGRYAPIMGKILEDNGLPRDLIFLAMAESGFQNNAKSWARAVGPWQFMSFTGRKYGLRISWYIDERRDPIKATIAAGKYLKDLYKIFGSWELAAAGYNAGEGKVGRAIRRYKTENFWKLRKHRYLKSETKNYVPKIMALAIIGKNLKSFGFDDLNFQRPLDFEELNLPSNTDLVLFADAMGIEFGEIKRLNPEILRWQTPPDQFYKLRIPVGTSPNYEKCCRFRDFMAMAYQKYTVKGKRASFKKIARKYKVKPKFLAELNGMPINQSLNSGDIIILPFREGQDKRDNMYADLYERPRKRTIRRRTYRRLVR